MKKMKKETEILEKTIEFVKDCLKDESWGHGWQHAKRVWKISLRIAEKEGEAVDLLVLQLAALFHDIEDRKVAGFRKKKCRSVETFLRELGLEEKRVDHILAIIRNISFKGAGVPDAMETAEGKIVQDADRLDALGAIGIARCFATGAILGRPIHDPALKPGSHRSSEDYRDSNSTSINHFYEKLLLLKDRMHTRTAKKIAEKRQRFMEKFLEKFFEEWEGKDF